ncbi:MAG: hypothetical protein JSU85_14770 [Candidatus Zixiibacteriota bacterium]|nr:MAG: hypothetical protein JSU85_14770 [candidate division Zixibacteria bacterium]
MITRIIGILIVIAVVFGALIIAGAQQTMAEGKHASFEGKLVCLGCTLKDEEGARAECKVYGHKHALQTEDGKYITFLENKYSEDLFKGEKYDDKEVSVHGVYYAGANQLDVESYTIDNVTITWCKTHNAMDGCNSHK